MINELAPRERVLLALSHQETDRVPVDFNATPEAWARLNQHLGIHDTEAVLRHLGVDLRHPRQPYVGPPQRRHSDGSWTDAWGVRRQSVPHRGGAYDEIVAHPLADVQDASELADYPWPQPEWWDADALAEQIQTLDADMPYAIALEEFGDPGGMFEIAWYMRGMEQFFVDMVKQPDIAYEIMRHVTDFYTGMLERVMDAVGDRIDLIWTSDDIAHQHGLLMSKSTWRELIAPHHERLNRRIHGLGTRVMYHSCGAVRPFIPDLIEIGVDVLDVLQFSADDMDPLDIKATFGNRLCFHGGIDVQSTLPFGTEEEVRQVTRERIEVLGKGGGYILAPTHNVQVDTPPQNIVAMYAETGSLRPSGDGR
ncbi:MAG: uroporphyrinogen decarboxylase family protein [Anaerolineae bacterium]